MTTAKTRESSEDSEFDERYEIGRTRDFIASHAIICLQFPDYLLPQAHKIYSKLKNCSNQVFILADSTFGNCCIDQVATRHIDTGAIIHYGNACLSNLSTKLNVLYIFDKPPINYSALEVEIAKFEKILIFTSTEYYYVMDRITCPNIIKSYINTNYPSSNQKWDHQVKEFCFDFEGEVKDLTVMYIGPKTTDTSILSLNFKKFLYFDPRTDLVSQESLNNALFGRRYHQIQRVKDCNVVGIVIGTLSVDLYLTVIDSLKALIIQAGKKPYLISIGKPNVAKLSNFLEIEAFCLIACKDNALLNSRDFMVPIVTPFELGIALSGRDFLYEEYDLDINGYLDAQFDIPDIISDAGSDDDTSESKAPHFSLITGQFVDNKKYAQSRRIEKVIEYDQGGGQVTKKDGTMLKVIGNSASADYLNSKRTFKGLELDFGLKIDGEKGEVVEVGRSGIASKYVIP